MPNLPPIAATFFHRASASASGLIRATLSLSLFVSFVAVCFRREQSCSSIRRSCFGVEECSRSFQQFSLSPSLLLTCVSNIDVDASLRLLTLDSSTIRGPLDAWAPSPSASSPCSVRHTAVACPTALGLELCAYRAFSLPFPTWLQGRTVAKLEVDVYVFLTVLYLLKAFGGFQY